MIIGVPKEIKIEEYRVGLVPESVHEIVKAGHEVWIEHDAGHGIHADDDAYRNAGARIAKDAHDVYARAEMVVKVKEPQPDEYGKIRSDQILFTYLHLAPDARQTAALIKSNCIAIAYETVTNQHGRLPLLMPMSEVAGRLSIQAGMHYLERHNNGAGILLGGVAGVQSGHITIIGGGVAGTEAIKVAVRCGAHVTVLDKSLDRLRLLNDMFGSHLTTLYALDENVRKSVINSDLVIGAVLIPGGAAPKVVTRDMIQKMRPGSVIVDIAIDQGGCFETSRPTTFKDPIYEVDGILHYCVTNMPGAVPKTSAFALNNATLPYILNLANNGVKEALTKDHGFLNGLNIYKGSVTYETVAKALGYDYTPPLDIL